MILTSRRFMELTAEDLMTRNVITIPTRLSLRAAAHCLAQTGVSGVPVIDDLGRCVGVLSKSDLVRFLDHGPHRCRCGEDDAGYFADWQVLDFEHLPADDVGHYMTQDPITARPETRIGELARLMHVGHVHRILITDSWDRVIGVVSSMDILGAVAAEDDHPLTTDPDGV